MSSVDVNVKSVATASYVFGNELKLRGEAKLVVQLFDEPQNTTPFFGMGYTSLYQNKDLSFMVELIGIEWNWLEFMILYSLGMFRDVCWVGSITF